MHCNCYRTVFPEYKKRKRASMEKCPGSGPHCGKGSKKNTALKTTAGVGGGCGPADAAKYAANNAVRLDDKKQKRKIKKTSVINKQ